MTVRTTISLNAIHYRAEDIAAIEPVATYLYSAKEVLEGKATTEDYMDIRILGTCIAIAINGVVAERLARAILAAVADRRHELGRRASVAELTEVA